jgi:hypothetical protein
MSDITEKVLEVRSAVVKKAVIFTAEDVSTGDTITLDDLSAIDGVAILNREDGSEVTQTVATNVITIGGSYSDIDVIGIAVGDSE